MIKCLRPIWHSLTLHIVFVNKKWKAIGHSRYLYRNEPDKACFKHDTLYGDFKDLLRRIVSVKALLDKAFKIVGNPILVSKTFDKRAADTNIYTRIEISGSITIKFKKHKMYSSFRDNIWGYCLTNMLLIKITVHFNVFGWVWT